MCVCFKGVCTWFSKSLSVLWNTGKLHDSLWDKCSCLQRPDKKVTEPRSLSLSLLLTHSLTSTWFISTIPKNLKVIFVICLQAGFAHCFAHPRSCKQQRFPTCKQTRSLIYLGLYVGHLSFWRPSESVHRLLNVRLSESRHFFGPAFTFCWAKNKVHKVHTNTTHTHSFHSLNTKAAVFHSYPKTNKAVHFFTLFKC